MIEKGSGRMTQPKGSRTVRRLSKTRFQHEHPMTLTEAMVGFAFSITRRRVPYGVEMAARTYLADTVACMVGAYDSEPAKVLRRWAIERGGGESTIIGSDHRVPADKAALVNGTMVRYLDANDILLAPGGRGGHFSDATPGLLAMAEKHGRSAEELVTCLVASYELQAALNRVFPFMSRGFHALTQVTWVAPIVLVRLAGGTMEQAVHAAGLSGATGMVLNTWLKPSPSIPWIKAVSVGMAGQRAVEAAELAMLGVTASSDALESAIEVLGPSAAEDVNMTAMGQLGVEWHTAGNIIKAYPSQIYTQAAVEASIELHRRGVRTVQIRKITLYGHRHVASGVQGSTEAYRPTGRESADHSTPYVMAMALLRGELTRREFEGAPWTRGDVRSLMQKIELVLDRERDLAFMERGVLGVGVEAELTDGRTESIDVRQPRGHPDTPFGQEDLMRKLSWLVEDVAAPGTARRLIELCNGMSTKEDLITLINACSIADG